jgi:general secretion pathway protein J
MSRREQGFTLVEVLVAVTVTAILLTTVFGIFTSVSRAKERVEGNGAGYHQARVLFDRIGRELRSAYLVRTNPNTRFEGGKDDEQHLFLELTTTTFTPYGGNRGGIARVRYELAPDDEAPAAKEPPWVLLRKEGNLFDPERFDQRPGYRLATGIREMQIRYQNESGEWFEEWPRSNNRLPQMVELTLTVEIDGAPVPLRTTYRVQEL